MNLQVPIQQMKEEGNWPLPWTSAVGLVEEVRSLGENIVGCEVGVSYGFNLVYFLENLPSIKQVYAIDPYAPYHDGPAGLVTQEVLDKVKDLFNTNTHPFKDKVRFINDTSENAHALIPDGSLDYIFIDGDHSFEAVYKDVRNFFSKVRPGGIFAGHDFSWGGVRKAVYEFRNEYNIMSSLKTCANDVWYWQK